MAAQQEQNAHVWYFYVLAQDGPPNAILYGITRSWDARLLSHRNSNPYPLTIVHQIRCGGRLEAARIERNFAGATRTYETSARNETRLSGVKRTKAYRDPLSIKDQCSLGHRMDRPQDVYLNVRHGWLPACRRCRLGAKDRFREKHLERMHSDPEYARQYKVDQRRRNIEWKAKNPEKVQEGSKQFTEHQRERRQSDPEFRKVHNARSSKWAKENRGKRDATQRAYRERVKPDLETKREYDRKTYAKIMADPERAERRREYNREATRRRMQDSGYRAKVNAHRRELRAQRRAEQDE